MVSFILVFLLSALAFNFLISRVQHDAEAINELGRIRGSIQRWTKLELSGQQDDELLNKIDRLMIAYASGEPAATLRLNWELLKSKMMEYRSGRDQEHLPVLIAASEQCWAVSDQLARQGQLDAEAKLKHFGLFGITFVVNLIIVGLLFVFVKGYVRDNLEVAALKDPLTNAYNRRYFEAFGLKEIEQASKEGQHLALATYDLDHFKRVNDTYGHAVGDQVLQTVTRVVTQQLRQADVLARIGGEEFAILLPETRGEEAGLIAERIRLSVEAADFGQAGRVTISVGVTEYRPGDTLAELLRRSDQALYIAKDTGRNRVERS